MKLLNGFQVIVIDSCEYLIKSDTSKGAWGSGIGHGFFGHKGNCKFCEERRKQEGE